jgi:hypothetical protein
MSIAYRIDDGVAIVFWDGLVKADEWLTHVRRLVADPAWPPSRGLHLSDLRSARIDESVDHAALTEAVALFGAHDRIRELRAAIVAGESFANARLFEDLIARQRGVVFAFNSLRPACDWLGIDPAKVEQSLELLRTGGTRQVHTVTRTTT